MVEHRTPPKPDSWAHPVKGTCRFCGLAVLNDDGTPNMRTYWHPICVIDYKMIFWPGVTRQAVFMRDAGVCALCGHHCARKGSDVWHLDHRQPLIEANGDIRYWMMDNLQTLCQMCHTAKTSREAGERAAARKAAKEGLPAIPQVELDPTLFSTDQTKIRDKLFAKENKKSFRKSKRYR
jgi:hypothetical protein